MRKNNIIKVLLCCQPFAVKLAKMLPNSPQANQENHKNNKQQFAKDSQIITNYTHWEENVIKKGFFYK